MPNWGVSFIGGIKMIFVYTGNGAGKTTASLGLSVRASGHGKKVIIVQFMKKWKTGEVMITEKFPIYEIYQFGRKEFVDLKNPSNEDKKLARDGWEFAKKIWEEKKPFLLVLDEINVAAAIGLLDISEVVEWVKKIPKEYNIVLTGRYAPEEFKEVADYVNEVVEVKHPYQKGVGAVEGIQY